MTKLAIIALLAVVMAGRGEAGDMTEKLHWLGHDAFRIDGPPVVYVDPYQLGDKLPPADVILITHDHFDHLSPADVAKIHRPGTVVVAPKEVEGKLTVPVTVISVGESKTVAGITVKAVPAYNTNKTFHPKNDGKVGFVFTVGGVTYYHAGDTDEVPEMAAVDVDVALLPVSGVYVMTPEEAAAACAKLRAKVVVPMHWGTVAGSAAEAQRFKELCPLPVEILRPAR